MTPYN